MRGAPSCPLPHCTLAASLLVELWSSYIDCFGWYEFSQVATTWNSLLLESNGTAPQCAWFENEGLNSWQDEWHFGCHKIDCTSLTYVPTLVRIFSSTRLLCKLQPLLCTRLMLLIMKCTSAALISMTLLPLQMSPSIPMWTSLSPYLQHKYVSI